MLHVDKENARNNFRKFICLVDRVLFLHYSSDIQRFHVKCYDDQGIDSFRANAWVSAALCLNVQELDLDLSLLEESTYKLPGDLFTCDTLVVLKLSIIFELNVPARACLPSLKVLHLEYVIYASDESIERLIASCPVLEDFVTNLFYWDNVPKFSISSRTLKRLTMVNDFDSTCCVKDVVINAPCLVYLEYEDYAADCYSLTNLDSLVEARVRMSVGYEFDYNVSVPAFFRGIGNVQSLYLSDHAIEAIQLHCHPLPVLCNLTRLEIDADEQTMAQGLPELLERCPNLENIFYKGLGVNRDGLYSGDWNPPEVVPSCLLFQLKEIVIYLTCWEKEVKMVKYFLKNARVLRNLTACSAIVEEKFQLKIAKELLMLPRGSSECEVMFI
ncbi:LRR_2 domain-containing protein/FBD domain-containing protein [Cephalotus follicularis]|uniref:LRR_2 domain-containing protein/FBD domain-containing protein n=1 Tax=Cephalotus follicularis TaxID=3775 RepID=A0A1Q3BYF9_CEPFO|nr:LRR_2 domain-containing protein/FBD domain-containing protein [Cephalotus follicularis]